MTDQPFSLANISQSDIGKTKRLKAYIAGEGAQKAVFLKYKVRCTKCNANGMVDLSKDPEQIYAKINNQEVHIDRIPEAPAICINGGAHKWVFEKDGEPTLYIPIQIRDSMEINDPEGKSSNRSIPAYFIGKLPDNKDVELIGMPLINPKNNNVEFLAIDVSEKEILIETYQLTKDDVNFLREYCSGRGTLKEFLELAKNNNPWIAGHEMAKLAVMLAYLSPIWIKVNELEKPGTLRALLFGDPRTGKGSIENYLPSKLHLGKHAIGETSSRTGITYTIDNDNGMLIWGVLVEADRGLVVIEGLHKFSPDDLATMRETLVKLYIEVRRSFSAKAWARTRIIADANSRLPMSNYPYPAMAIPNLACFLDAVDITRWDIYIPFISNQVSPAEITKANLTGKDNREFLSAMDKLIRWMWSRSSNNIHFTEDALYEAQKGYEELFNKYSLPEIPIIHEDSFFTILKIATSFAALTFSTLDGENVEVKPEHIHLALEYLHEMVSELELDKYIETVAKKGLTEEVYEEFVSLLETSEVANKIVGELIKGPKNSKELANLLETSDVYVREVIGKFETIDTISRVNRGYKLTSIGVQAWRRYMYNSQQVGQEQPILHVELTQLNHLGNQKNDHETSPNLQNLQNLQQNNGTPSSNDGLAIDKQSNSKDGGMSKPVSFVSSVSSDSLHDDQNGIDKSFTRVSSNGNDGLSSGLLRAYQKDIEDQWVSEVYAYLKQFGSARTFEKDIIERLMRAGLSHADAVFAITLLLRKQLMFEPWPDFYQLKEDLK